MLRPFHTKDLSCLLRIAMTRQKGGTYDTYAGGKHKVDILPIFAHIDIYIYIIFSIFTHNKINKYIYIYMYKYHVAYLRLSTSMCTPRRHAIKTYIIQNEPRPNPKFLNNCVGRKPC